MKQARSSSNVANKKKISTTNIENKTKSKTKISEKSKKAQFLEKLERRKLENEEEEGDYGPLKKRKPKGRPLAPNINKKAYLEKQDISYFMDIEHHIHYMPRVPSIHLTFNKLIADLYIPYLTELEIARTFFIWVTWQDYVALKDMVFSSETAEDSPLGFLRDIAHDKKRFSQLFCRLCQAAKLHVKEITGFVKGSSWFPDYEFSGLEDPSRGAWNAVFIDGHWRFIDTRRSLSAAENETNNGKNREEFFFLPDPDALINTHFPDDKQWQLMPVLKTVNLEEFQKSPKKWPNYYLNTMTLPSELPGLINVGTSGEFQLKFSVPLISRVNETYKCELLTRENMEKVQDGVVLTRYLLHYTEEDSDFVHIYLPKKGEYILEIYVMSKRPGQDSLFNIVAIYQLNCDEHESTPESDFRPLFPKICSYYGFSQHGFEIGLAKVTPIDSLISCDKYGEGKVTVLYSKPESKEEFIEFAHSLYPSESEQTKPLKDRILQSVSYRDNRFLVTFRIRLPNEGNFALILYFNRNKQIPRFTDFAHYLVSWRKNTFPNNPSFPKLPGGKLGPISPNFEKLSLRLVGVFPAESNDINDGCLNVNESGEGMICFEHSEPVAFMVEKVDEMVESMIECTQFYSFITVRVQPKDTRKTFLLKIFGSKVNKVDGIPQVYQFMVFADKPAKRSQHLPLCPVYYWGAVQNKLQDRKTTVTGFTNSVSWTQSKFRIKSNDDLVPCRLYAGGEDLQLFFKYKTPYPMKPTLKMIEHSGQEINFDRYCISQLADSSNSTIRARFPKKGVYSLAVFAGSFDDEDTRQNTLTSVFYSLIVVDIESAIVKPFPHTFSLWTSSYHQLITGLDDTFFKRGEESVLKVNFLVNFDVFLTSIFS